MRPISGPITDEPYDESEMPFADQGNNEGATFLREAVKQVGKCLGVENRVMILILIAWKPGLSPTELVSESRARMSPQTAYNSIKELAKTQLLSPKLFLESDGTETITKIGFELSEHGILILDTLGFSAQQAQWGFAETRTFSAFVANIGACFRNENLVHTMALLRQAGASGLTRSELGHALKLRPDVLSKCVRELSIAGLVRRKGGPEVRICPDLIMVQLMDVVTALARVINAQTTKGLAMQGRVKEMEFPRSPA